MEVFEIIIGIVLLICFLYVPFAFFMLFRNYWVCNERNKFIDKNFDEYYKLMSYSEMLWRFWIWDINKMKRK